MKSIKQAGFTAIELLITLFVAAAFLVSGFQLYNVIIKGGGNTRAQSRASNVAYDYMRRYSSTVLNPCAVSTPVNNASISVAGISAVTVKVDVTCPYASQTSLSKIEVTVNYNNPQQTTKYSTYATGTGSIIDSLVGWWKFDGNANDSSGNNNNGTVTGATLTTGENSQSNSAYSFNGSSNYITLANTSSLSLSASDISVSAWVNIPTVPVAAWYDIFSSNTSDWSVGLTSGSGSARLQMTDVNIIDAPASSQALSLNTWYNTVVTYSTLTHVVDYYINGQSADSVTWTGVSPYLPFVPGTKIIGARNSGSSGFFNGAIDDVRVYSRALTSTEVSALYNAGAQ